ncbi:MAG TPA: ABC transporter substrate-binding protein [Terricaulis sp.]|nr:ABC transporter substrate-binding protein [Terricaulis sp.]
MVRVLVCAIALLFAWPAHAAPQRIVSLDYCADQFVLALADRSQIAALSRGARRDDSYFRDRAGGIRQTRGTLEEVLALRPDLVVRSWGGPWDAAQVYGRFGVPVLQIDGAPSFDGARAMLLSAANELGHPERGAMIARDLDQRLARLAAAPAPADANVLYLTAGGAVAGRGTMMDALIQAAGGRNVRDAESWAVLPLETLVQTPPALIALGFFDHGRTAMNAWAPGRHPALRRALAEARTVSLSPAAISCEAWFAIDAAEAIAAVLRAP